MPRSVYSRGYSSVSGAIDHLVTNYAYDEVPLVVAEGGWAMAKGFEFSMTYTINFERATASFTFDGESHVTLVESGQEPRQVELVSKMGYDYEIAYFLNCIERGKAPTIVTLQSAADSIRIAEAEAQSIKAAKPVSL